MVARIAYLGPEGTFTEAALLMLLALSANSLSKLVAAWVSGGGRFALRVAPGLALLVAAPWTAWALWPAR